MTTTQIITATDLEEMGSDAWFELIQGVLYPMSPSSAHSSAVGMLLGIHLGSFVNLYELGILTGENGGYILERYPDTVVAPDVGFISEERLALWPDREGYFPGPPDLAVEIISPTDEMGDIRRKKSLYDRIGVPLCWWIDPKRRTATVHAPGHPVQHLTESDTLEGELVVPGYSLLLGSLFEF